MEPGSLESGDHITQVRPGGMWHTLYALSTPDQKPMKGRPFWWLKHDVSDDGDSPEGRVRLGMRGWWMEPPASWRKAFVLRTNLKLSCFWTSEPNSDRKMATNVVTYRNNHWDGYVRCYWLVSAKQNNSMSKLRHCCTCSMIFLIDNCYWLLFFRDSLNQRPLFICAAFYINRLNTLRLFLVEFPFQTVFYSMLKTR